MPTKTDSEHLRDLKKLRDDCKARMQDCDSDQNYVQLGKLLIDAWKQINEISGESTIHGGRKISEFEQRLAQRRKTS